MAPCIRNHYFEGWRESWETFCATICENIFQCASRNNFFVQFFAVWDPNGVPGGNHGEPTNYFSGYFFHPAFFGGFWGTQGRQNTS